MASTKGRAKDQQFFDSFYPGTSQALAFNASGGASVQATQLQKQTSLIRLFCTTDCWITVSQSSGSTAAANTSMYLPAGIVEYVSCAFKTASGASAPPSSSPSYVNALGVAGAGTLYICEGN